MHRIPALDGLRALAILAVMAYHLSLAAAKGGFLGVDLFFVLSGYLITRVLMEDSSLGRFYTRRALRILPPLVVAVLLAVVLNPVKLQAIAAGLLFYANFVRWEALGPLAHLWSLAIEEHFYLVWPFVFLCAGRWRVPILWATVVCALLLRILALAAGVEDEWVHKLSALRADGLAIGCLVALRSKAWNLGGACGASASLLAVAACFSLVRWPSFALLSFGFTAFALLCGVALGSVLGSGDSVLNRVLSMPAARYIGRRSYGLYLFHWPIYTAINASGYTVQWPITCLAAKIIFTLAVSEFSFRTVERAADRIKATMDRGRLLADTEPARP